MTGIGFITSIWTMLREIGDAISQARAAHDTYFNLASLPDESLSKMGIERSNIAAIAFELMKNNGGNRV